jgi:hypothetical protein
VVSLNRASPTFKCKDVSIVLDMHERSTLYGHDMEDSTGLALEY